MGKFKMGDRIYAPNNWAVRNIIIGSHHGDYVLKVLDEGTYNGRVYIDKAEKVDKAYELDLGYQYQLDIKKVLNE